VQKVRAFQSHVSNFASQPMLKKKKYHNYVHNKFRICYPKKNKAILAMEKQFF